MRGSDEQWHVAFCATHPRGLTTFYVRWTERDGALMPGRVQLVYVFLHTSIRTPIGLPATAKAGAISLEGAASDLRWR